MRMRRIVLATATAVLIAGSAVTATAQASTPSADTITKLPAKVTLTVGHQATLTLKTNITTGTRWIVAGTPCCTPSGKAIAKVSKGTYTAPVTTLVGAPGTTSWTITALRPGTGYVTVVTRPAGVQNTMQDEEVGRVKVTVTR
jgi:predicted secreted protein